MLSRTCGHESSIPSYRFRYIPTYRAARDGGPAVPSPATFPRRPVTSEASKSRRSASRDGFCAAAAHTDSGIPVCRFIGIPVFRYSGSVTCSGPCRAVRPGLPSTERPSSAWTARARTVPASTPNRRSLPNRWGSTGPRIRLSRSSLIGGRIRMIRHPAAPAPVPVPSPSPRPRPSPWLPRPSSPWP